MSDKPTKSILRFISADGMYNPGDVAGFRPDVAYNLVEVAKRAVWVGGLKPERDTSQAAEPRKAAIAPAPPQQPARTGLEKAAAKAAAAKQAAAEKAAAEKAGDNDGDGGNTDPVEIDIPEDWKEAHHNKRRGWASKIVGDVVASADDADRIIDEYLATKPQG